MTASGEKTLGQAIDDIIAALEALDEGARTTAIRAACDHLGISSAQVAQQSQNDVTRDPNIDTQGITDISEAKSAADIRTLKEQKAPSTAQEMACLVAYYLESLAPLNDRIRAVGPADLEKYFKQAGFRLPKRIPQVLVDAKAAGYFDSTGRGKYKLNPVGHNLVVHNLPKAKK